MRELWRWLRIGPIGLMGLIGSIGLSVALAADIVSTNFIIRDSALTGGGGRSESAGFIGIGALGQPVSGETTSAGFTNQAGLLYFTTPASLSGLAVSVSKTDDTTARFVLTWTADSNFREFRVCRATVQGDLTNCSGTTAVSATVTSANHTFSGLAAGAVYYFQVTGYDLDGNPGVSTSIVSATTAASGGTIRMGGGAVGQPMAVRQPAAQNQEVEPPLEVQPPIAAGETISGGGIIRQLITTVTSVIKTIGALLRPGLPAPSTQLATPVGFQGNFRVLPDKVVEQLIFADLPEDIVFLLKQFPELKKTFQEVGVKRASDIVKLGRTKFRLPELTSLTAVNLPEGLKLADMSSGVKERLPRNVHFVRSFDESVDLRTSLVFNDVGKPRQVLNVVAGEQIKLIIKPERPAKKVEGYLTYAGKETPLVSQIPVSSLAASLILTRTSLAREIASPSPRNGAPRKNQEVEPPAEVQPPSVAADEAISRNDGEELLLSEFDYADIGGNVFEAILDIPEKQGVFNVATIIYYKNQTLPVKNVDLLAVVDPRGYVYEQTKRGKIRLAGAEVSLFKCEPDAGEKGNCALWPAADYQQDNPQITGDSGEYSFLTPPGQYYLETRAPAYEIYVSERFIVKEGAFLNHNLNLQRKVWWKRVLGIFGL